jgi:DNA-binding transcriptional LysR family regulator
MLSRGDALLLANFGTRLAAVHYVAQEHDLGVRLVDRNSREVEPTLYAHPVLSRCCTRREGRQLKMLPVDVPTRPWLLTIMTLKDRTLSPALERFIEFVREVTRLMREGPASLR